MNFFYLVPFNYFYLTRLKHGSFVFHFLFEWVAAFWLVAWVGIGGDLLQSSLAMLFSYLAFISIYELGYMANDLHAAKQEIDGRRRGPQEASRAWIFLWVISRLFSFLVCTILMNKLFDPAWWSFFAALIFVFLLHNILTDREQKVATFSLLAWFRFMAPVIFVVSDNQIMGVGLAAAIGYVAYRNLGYMDSKGLLLMPGRKRMAFRLFFFLMPFAGIVALWPYEDARGYCLLVTYWGIVSATGAVATYKSS